MCFGGSETPIRNARRLFVGVHDRTVVIIYIDTFSATCNQNAHLSANIPVPTCWILNPTSLTTNCFSFPTSGTPTTLAFVTLCAFGSPV